MMFLRFCVPILDGDKYFKRTQMRVSPVCAAAVQCGGNNTGDGGGGACLVLLSSVGRAISGKCRLERRGAGIIIRA